MSGPLIVSTLSKKFVEVPVRPKDSAANPTSDVVALAFIEGPGKPAGGDFVTGVWRTGSSGTFYAGALIGPGSTKVLTPGRYSIWVKFTDNPEVPVDPAGYVIIR